MASTPLTYILLHLLLLSDSPLCLLPGVLQLNQQVVSCSQDGVPMSLQLLPRQTYLNVDEDAAGTLERKRNYIYCLIVHIMKQEKEMHIDNLVFKVRGRHRDVVPLRHRDTLRHIFLPFLFTAMMSYSMTSHRL